MKRRLSSALLALVLSLCVTTSACAADTNASETAPDATASDLAADTAPNTSGFSDVEDSAWYADAVRYVSEKGLMVGTGNHQFSPDDTFTRAQVATILYHMAGQPKVSGEDGFTDTNAGQWYSDSVLWCTREGMIEGYGGGLFGTFDPVTQEQLLTLFYRFIDEPTSAGADREDVSAYAQNAVRWALAAEVANENAGYAFVPQSAATRAIVAVMLTNFDRLRTSVEDTAVDSAIQLKVNDTPLTVQWEGNESVDALKELLKDAPLTIQMSMYGGFEQVGSLGASLPRGDVQTTASAGDIVLYSGSNIVMFYGSNSWAYTRLGKIIGLDNQELRELLGSGDVTVTLNLDTPSSGGTACSALAWAF